MANRRKYATEAERVAAQKAYAAAYRQAKRDGTWKPKHKTHKPRRDGATESNVIFEEVSDGVFEAVYPDTSTSSSSPIPHPSSLSSTVTKRTIAPTKRKNRVFDPWIAARRGEYPADPKLHPSAKERERLALIAEEHKAELDEIRRKAQKKLERKEKNLHRQELAEKKAAIKEIYGFDLGAHIETYTPEELEGRRRWARDIERHYNEIHREHINNYNREYHRRKRAEALAVAQKCWTAEEWEKYNARLEAKERGKGTTAWLIREVAKQIVKEEFGNLPDGDGTPSLPSSSSLIPHPSSLVTHDTVGDIFDPPPPMTEYEQRLNLVMDRLMTGGGIEFLTAGMESFGKKHGCTEAFVRAAAAAVRFYIDPDESLLFQPTDPRILGKSKRPRVKR